MLLDITETLNSISDFVNSCLAFLGMDFSQITGKDWAKWATDFGIQIIATIILFILVRFLLWKPLTKMITARRDAIDKELNDAKEANKEAQTLKQDLSKQLVEAQEEVKRILQAAEIDGNQRRDEIITEAKEEARQRIEASRLEVEREIESKQQEIKTMIVNTAFEAASKILEHEVDKEKYLSIVEEVIEGAKK
jgi:F-type H+-transporting ATPase subunit b